MRPLRFCMVTTFYPPHNFGGDGIAVQRLARALARRGHEVTVACNTDAFVALGGHVATPAGGEAADGQAADGVTVHRLSTSTPRLASLLIQQTGRPALARRSLRRVLGQRFDVIHYHNVSLIGGPAVLGMGDAVKLYTAHEHWLVCPTHVLWRNRREPCTARQCVRCQLAYHRPPQLWRHTGHLERQLAHVDTFIACSEFSRRKHREMGFPRDMRVLPPVLDDVAPDARGPSPHPRPYFLFAGRLERIKGLDDVLPLMRDHAEADLLVAGDGPHRGALEHIAAGSPRVRFLGRLEPAALGTCYAHALAVIVPSVGYETFGLAAAEAMRQGIPVLARRMGPLVDLVTRSGGGELFSTPAELAASMRRLQGDPARRSELGRSGRAAFLAEFSEAVVVPGYLDLVADAARRRGRRDVLSALGKDRAA